MFFLTETLITVTTLIVMVNGQLVSGGEVSLNCSLTLTMFVLQWTWIAANNWGSCHTGGRGMGCGPQVNRSGNIVPIFHDEKSSAV